MQRKILILIWCVVCAATMHAADPTATTYPIDDCLGSAKPYPVPAGVAQVPDSLTPVLLNHVGRHGSRFLSSSRTSVELARELQRADSAGVLSPLGKDLLGLTNYVIETSHNRWGALDSLGMAEQRGIASRMVQAYPVLFDNGRVDAISSYAPRCVMSMYEFTHQIDRLNNKVEIYTSAGRQNSALMRPFEVVEDYVAWAESEPWKAPYDMFFETTVPAAPARRLLTDAGFLSNEEALALTWNEYKVLSGVPAMGLAVDLKKYFSVEEMNALWSCENLAHYLKRTATTLSLEPAYVATDLLLNLIDTTEHVVNGEAKGGVCLRFGHAETLMPLLSLMHLRGCYYMTNYFDTVALHWKDFYVVPMSANLQMVLFKSVKGKYYVRFSLNEVPVPLFPDSDDVFLPWYEVREYLVRCLPPHLQI